MKRIKLVVLSLCALVFSAPIGFSTANAADAPPDTADRQLEDYTVDDLTNMIAPKYGVEITSGMKKADIVAAIKAAAGYSTSPGAEETPEQRIARLEAQVDRLTKASPVALPVVTPVVTGSTALMIQGAGVNEADVTWRVRAGLTPAQAVEVALQEKNEAANRKEAKK